MWMCRAEDSPNHEVWILIYMYEEMIRYFQSMTYKGPLRRGLGSMMLGRSLSLNIIMDEVIAEMFFSQFRILMNIIYF